ncbi:M20 family metallopeptidase [Sulfitobacter sp. G21635-S1]|uniref:M20 family metallopeptidase n=1 Tax=Sulfitobacter sp. G21635-S1 TaxID=3014043 RepID=UPI0022AF00D0|nr:M20 family metallopeptidase [Sulfitobacter sp. G21635-S1]MCZ4254088.1 M20 family metallopeptidase [Sulfitobacter sp. G21635-S1]
MTLQDSARANIETYFDSGDFQRDLATLVSRPTESQDPRGKPHLHAYLHDDMAPMLGVMGFACRFHDNPVPDGPPILTAERIEDASLPTVLTYGHGDVVRAQEGQWREGLTPFELIEEGDRLYGRGSADNKVQHLINLRAMLAVLKAQGHLGFNAKVIIEMGEEAGSPGLKEFCTANADLLKADVFIASDGPRLRPAAPTIFTGSRGGASFDLEVKLREGANHSGNFGGLLADPAMILSHALASITDARGQIRIPEWRPTSLTPRIREVLAALPAHDTGIDLDADWGEADLTPAERVFGWNSFAILAMTAGVPAAPVNAIAGSARATCQLRFVVGTDVDDILPALRRHLDREGFDKVKIVAHSRNSFPATRLDPDHPMVRFASASIEKSVGIAPDILPNLGGSLPNDCFAEVLGLPTIWVPHSYAGCSQHAPNEHILKSLSRQALVAMTGLFADLAEQGLPKD